MQIFYKKNKNYLCDVVAHERLTEPRVTIGWLLAKPRSFSNRPLFKIFIVYKQFYKILYKALYNVKARSITVESKQNDPVCLLPAYAKG